MKKTLIVSLIVVALLCTMVFMFTACDTGKYENADRGYINLKIGGKFVAEIKTLSGTTTYKGTYEVAKEADDNGNRAVTFKNEKGDTMLVEFGASYIDKDGALVVVGLAIGKYVK